MYHQRRCFAPYLLGCVLMAAAGGAGAQSEVRAIEDIGPDGDEHYHNVTCVDGTRASVTVSRSTQTVCLDMPRRDKLCRNPWTVVDAAAHACRLGTPPLPESGR